MLLVDNKPLQLHIYIFVIPQSSTVDTPSVINDDDKQLFQRYTLCMY